MDLGDAPGTQHRLRLVVEEAKRSLSTRQETTLHFDHAGRPLRMTLTRQEFEARTADLVDRTVLTVRRLIREAKRTYRDLTRLLVVGGASRMPMIAAALTQETGFPVDRAVPADEAVGQGAAIHAGYLLQQGRGPRAGTCTT